MEQTEAVDLAKKIFFVDSSNAKIMYLSPQGCSNCLIFFWKDLLCTIMFNVFIHSIYVLPGELKVLIQSTFCFAFCDMTKT